MKTMKAAGGNTDARSRLRAQGLRTRTAIVDVARQLLFEGGSLEFSLREVAARAGISVSNLQYYFPTRLAVLRAVVEPVIDTYLAELRKATDSNAPPHVTLTTLAGQALLDAKNGECATLWWHFVSLAAIDPECSRLLDDWYETLTREIARLIRSAYPVCSVPDSLHRATLLIALADGLNYQLAAGRRKRGYTRGLDAQYLDAADSLLRSALPAGR
jgi:AcrR family transcriptional regulator